jgi:Domain of unknown function (DUF4412)
MKTPRIPTLLIGLLALSVGLSAKDFEGKVRLKTTVANGQETLTDYFLKGGFMRVETEAGPKGTTVSIFDSTKREITVLMPDKKMYMVNKLPDPKKLEEAAAKTQVEFVRTGETEKILGYRCEKVLITSKDSSTEAWGAEGMGTFMSLVGRGPMGGPASKSAWEDALAEHGFFPLRSVRRNKAGKEISRTEAVSVEPQSVPASSFAPPEDYKKFEMPSLRGLNPFGKKDD